MITIATDGSCIGNPGPGAYGFVVDHNDSIRRRAIPIPATTVGEMEVRALLEALLYVADGLPMSPIKIICDSQYVVNGYNDWMSGWEAKGWHKKGGLAHAALWKRIAETKRQVGGRVTVEWIRAHQNNGSLNDQVDALVNACARNQTPVNGPSIQDGAISEKAPPQPALGETLTAALSRPSEADLVALLKKAQSIIGDLARPSDVEAHEFSQHLDVVLERY